MTTIFMDGPFKGIYSLAIVNRKIAALLAKDNRVLIKADEHDILRDNYFSDDGLADCAVADAPDEADVHLRNTWPPSAQNMIGKLNGYVSFAWEETKFPVEYIDEFNTYLDFICVVSDFCANVLLQSGLRIPVINIGNGTVANALRGPDSETSEAIRVLARKVEPYEHVILHISSGFWRKGVDILVDAFCQQFANDYTTCLIIKTFDNPDNIVTRVVESMGNQSAIERIFVERAEYTPTEMSALRSLATCIALPSRGEGFLLPAAEALACGLPVVTTAFSGATDFCTPKTAWLVDYDFIPSTSHVAPEESLVAGPSRGSLALHLERLHPRNDLRDVRSKSAAGVELIRKSYTWEAVGERLNAVLMASRSPSGRWNEAGFIAQIALVTTWNERCGIFEYSKAMRNAVERVYGVSLNVYTRSLHNNNIVSGDEPFVSRFGSFSFDVQSDLINTMLNCPEHILIFQHHLGHISERDLAAVFLRLVLAGKCCVVVAHNARDWLGVEETILAANAPKCLIIVHSGADMMHLHQRGYRNVVQIDHPIDRDICAVSHQVRDIVDDPVITTFGFLLPHKGFDRLLYLIAYLRRFYPKIRLQMLTSSQGNIKSSYTLDKLKDLANYLGVSDAVSFDTTYLTQNQIGRLLAKSDLIVLPYYASSEGASGAVRTCLRSGTPIVTSDVQLFASVRGYIPNFRADSISSMARVVTQLLTSPVLREGFSQTNIAKANKLSWDRLIPQFVGACRVPARAGFESFVQDCRETIGRRVVYPVTSQIFCEGWHNIEVNREDEAFRWMSQEASISLDLEGAYLSIFSIRVSCSYRNMPFQLTAFIDGIEASVSVTADLFHGFYIYIRPQGIVGGGTMHQVKLFSSYHAVPKEVEGSPDDRCLSLMVMDAAMETRRME